MESNRGKIFRLKKGSEISGVFEIKITCVFDKSTEIFVKSIILKDVISLKVTFEVT